MPRNPVDRPNARRAGRSVARSRRTVIWLASAMVAAVCLVVQAPPTASAADVTQALPVCSAVPLTIAGGGSFYDETVVIRARDLDKCALQGSWLTVQPQFQLRAPHLPAHIRAGLDVVRVVAGCHTDHGDG